MPKKSTFLACFLKEKLFKKTGVFIIKYNVNNYTAPQNVGVIRIPLELREALNLDNGDDRFLKIEIEVLKKYPNAGFFSRILKRIFGKIVGDGHD